MACSTEQQLKNDSGVVAPLSHPLKPGCLENQVALITGASAGIGRATAGMLAQFGADIVNVDMNRADKSQDTQTRKLVEQVNRRYLFIEANVGNEVAVRNAVQATVSQMGSPSILFCSAGTCDRSTLTDSTVEGYERDMAAAKGVYLLCKHVIPLMEAREYGRIIIMSSISAFNGGANAKIPSGMYYAQAKCAADAGSKWCAKKYARAGINVNAIAPCGVEHTGVTGNCQHSVSPLGRICQTEDVATTVLYLASPMAHFMTGTTLFLDGGQHLDW